MLKFAYWLHRLQQSLYVNSKIVKEIQFSYFVSDQSNL